MHEIQTNYTHIHKCFKPHTMGRRSIRSQFNSGLRAVGRIGRSQVRGGIRAAEQIGRGVSKVVRQGGVVPAAIAALSKSKQKPFKPYDAVAQLVKPQKPGKAQPKPLLSATPQNWDMPYKPTHPLDWNRPYKPTQTQKPSRMTMGAATVVNRRRSMAPAVQKPNLAPGGSMPKPVADSVAPTLPGTSSSRQKPNPMVDVVTKERIAKNKPLPTTM